MDAKEFYKEKLLILEAARRSLKHFRKSLADLSTLEERQPVPDHGPLYELNAAVDDLGDMVDSLVDEVEPMAE